MINVAIDGPAGAGKSTISKGAAKELGFICGYGCIIPHNCTQCC